MNSSTLVLNGQNLTIQDLVSFINNPDAKVALGGNTKEAIKRSERFLQTETKSKVTYGANTGFGPMASYILSPIQLEALQVNLVRSHAVGLGDPIPEEYVLAAMVTRLNMLVRGLSGVSLSLVEQVQKFINHRIIPVVPEHGAVGTSGDLIQLAHIALAYIGEGTVFYQGEIHPTSEILKKLKLSPYKLKAKEGLALINGTACMSGIFALLCAEASHLLNLSIHTAAIAAEIVNGFTDSFSSQLQSFRPHPGQVKVAELMRKIVQGSKRLRDRKKFQGEKVLAEEIYIIPEAVQEVYSLRCVPQILGPIWETLEEAKRTTQIELNGISDNPIVDTKSQTFWHGGNFHGEYIAARADQLKAQLIKLVMLSERRINFFLNPNQRHGLPPFLNSLTPGLTLGLQGLQFVATSTVSDCQSLAYPHAIHSITTNGDNQDVVSMGTDAALFLSHVVENAYIVLAIELVTLTQGMDLTRMHSSFSPQAQKLYKQVRSIVPKIHEDRHLTPELTQLVQTLKTNKEILK